MTRWLTALRTRFPAPPAWLVDAGLAVALAGVELIFLWRVGAHDAEPPIIYWRAAAGVLLMTLPLIARRRAPFTVFLVVAVAWAMYSVMAVGSWTGVARLNVGAFAALYAAAAYARRRQSWAAAAITALGLFGLYVGLGRPDFVPFLATLFAATWILGTLARTRRLYVAGLERDRNAQTRLAVARRRSRIARDLHDVVAHLVSVVHVQTRAARGALVTDPQAADQALAAVEQTAGEALSEMRRMLGALREDDDLPARAPQPRLEDVRALVDRFRRAGLPVRLVQSGTPRPLPAAIALSAYRIVQEGLTNVLKHAAAPRDVVVGLEWRPAALQVSVVDDGRASPPDFEEGRGLTGMRERVALLGGSMTASPAAAGGFRVHATIPLDLTKDASPAMTAADPT
jgi:signal transduction histidine kinase